MRSAPSFCLLICLAIRAQEIPRSTELSGDPFFVKKSWFIGGAGNWDYLTMDAASRRLYIAHGREVQVFDPESGSLAGEIRGFQEAHAIALDDTGEFGYVSDGPANDVKVFNRRTFAVEATIPISCSPRSIAFESRNKLLFATCGANSAIPGISLASNRRPATGGANGSRPGIGPEQTSNPGTSHVVAIDTETNRVLADMLMAGDYRFVQPDGDGQVYISVGPAQLTSQVNGKTSQVVLPQQIAKLDAQAILTEVHRQLDQRSQTASASGQTILMDWIHHVVPDSLVRFLPLPSACGDPQGLATDSQHQRLFAACDRQRFVVLNSSSGNLVASFTTGPGDDVLAYDHDRGLIFIANGAGYGSLTIVRQDAITDSYAVIQNLPTQERARTLAVDSATGEVYLVTDFHGVDLTKTGGIGTLHSDPVAGSFQVVVVGH